MFRKILGMIGIYIIVCWYGIPAYEYYTAKSFTKSDVLFEKVSDRCSESLDNYVSNNHYTNVKTTKPLTFTKKFNDKNIYLVFADFIGNDSIGQPIKFSLVCEFRGDSTGKGYVSER